MVVPVERDLECRAGAVTPDGAGVAQLEWPARLDPALDLVDAAFLAEPPEVGELIGVVGCGRWRPGGGRLGVGAGVDEGAHGIGSVWL